MKDTAGGNDEEATRPDTGAAFDIAVRKVVRRLFDVMVARDAIDAALRTGDVLKVHSAAQDLSGHWQAAQRELKGLEARSREVREHLRQAHAVRDQHRRALDELFRRVLARIDDPTVRERLAALSAEVGLPEDRGSEHDGERSTTQAAAARDAERSTAP